MCTIKCGLSLKYKMLPALLKEQGFKTHALGKVPLHHSNAQLYVCETQWYLLLALLTLRAVLFIECRLFYSGTKVFSERNTLRLIVASTLTSAATPTTTTSLTLIRTAISRRLAHGGLPQQTTAAPCCIRAQTPTL